MTKTPNLLELSRRSWKEALNIFSNNIIQNGPGKTLESKTTRLLPRKDAVLYGEFPKLDTIVLVKCNKCGNVLTPSAYRDHYNNPDHDKAHTGGKSIPNNASKVTKPNTYIPPGTSLLKKKYQQPKNSKKKTSLPTVVPPPPPPPPVFTKQSPPPPVITLYENPPLTPPISKPASPPQQPRVLFSSGSPSNGKPKKTKKSGKRSQDKDKKIAKTESTTEVTTTLPKATLTPRKERPKPKDFQVMIDLTVADMPSLVKSSKDSTTTSTTFKNTIPFTEEDGAGKTIKAVDNEPSVEEGVRVALEVVVKVLHMSSFRNSHTSVAEILDNEKSKVHLPTAKIPYSIHACKNVKGLFDKSSTEMNKPIRLINKNDLQCPECRELLKYTACSWKDITEVYNRDMKKYVGKKLAENEITNTAEYDVELYYALWHDKGSHLNDKTLKGSIRKDNTIKTDASKTSDTMVVVECVKCGNVLLPCIYQDHYTQADHVKTSHTNKRSNISSLKSIPPGTSLLKKKYQPVKSKKSDIPPAVPALPLAVKNTSKHTIIATYEETPQIVPVIKSTSPKQVLVSTVTDSSSNQMNNEEEMENMDAQVEEDVMAMLAQLAPIADSPTFNDWQVLSDLNGTDVPSPSQRTATTSPFVSDDMLQASSTESAVFDDNGLAGPRNRMALVKSSYRNLTKENVNCAKRKRNRWINTARPAYELRSWKKVADCTKYTVCKNSFILAHENADKTDNDCINLREYSGRSWKEVKQIFHGDYAKRSDLSQVQYDCNVLPRKDMVLYDLRVLVQCRQCNKIVTPCKLQAHNHNAQSDDVDPPRPESLTPIFSTITPAPQQSCMETNDLLKLLDEAIASVPDNSTSVVYQPLSPVDIANLPVQLLDEAIASATISNTQENLDGPPQIIYPSLSREDFVPVQNIDHHPPWYCLDTVDIIKSLNDAIEIASCDINTHENVESPLSIVYQSISPSEIIGAPVQKYSASSTSISTAEAIELLKNLNETISSCSRRQSNQRRVENHSVPYHPASPIDFVHHPVQESFPIDSQSDASIESGIMMLTPILNGVPNYTSHPKPLTMNTRSIRKIGTTYLLQSQRMDDQRNDIHSVLKKTLNSFHHRPNILKNSVRNNMKVGTKRSISERLMNDNNKHARLNDVNGFVLHTDTSESSDSNSVGFLK